jgi:hypothetical protein
MPRTTASLVQLAVLAFWLGAAALFTTVVAQAVFAVLPTRTLAGLVVGRVLPAVFYSGALVGFVVIAVEYWTDDRWTWRGRESAAVVMLVACLIAQLAVAPRIERIRAAMGGSLENLPLADPRRVDFGRLHAVSVAWLGIAMIAAAVGLVLAARSIPPRT